MSMPFSNADLNACASVLEKIARNPDLLNEPMVRNAAIRKYLNENVFIKPIPGAPGKAASNLGVAQAGMNRASSPTANRSRMNDSITTPSSTNRAQSPTARAGSPSRPVSRMNTTVVQDQTQHGPSGSSKYSSGQASKKTTCVTHKYGVPP